MCVILLCVCERRKRREESACQTLCVKARVNFRCRPLFSLYFSLFWLDSLTNKLLGSTCTGVTAEDVIPGHAWLLHGLHSAPHACTASTLLTEPSSHPSHYVLEFMPFLGLESLEI